MIDISIVLGTYKRKEVIRLDNQTIKQAAKGTA